MATIVIFDRAKLGLLTGDVNLSATMRGWLMSTGWTPNIDTSTIASLTTYFHTKLSGSFSDGRRINPPGGGTLADQVTKTADGVLKFDLSDVAFTASSGASLSAQYGVVAKSGGTIPILYWQLSTAEVVATQVTVQWPAAGLFETSDNT